MQEFSIADFLKLQGKELEAAYFGQPRIVRKEIQNVLTPEQKTYLEPLIYARRGIAGKVNGELIFTPEAKQARLERLQEKSNLLKERIKIINAEIKQLEGELS